MTKLNRLKPVDETMKEGHRPDESGVQPISVSGDAADRQRITNLLRGRFVDMCQLNQQAHQRFDLLPGSDALEADHPPFPSSLQFSRSFSAEEYAHATPSDEPEDNSFYRDPMLIACPPNKTWVDLLAAISKDGGPVTKTGLIIRDDEFSDFDPDTAYRSFIADGALQPGNIVGDVRIFSPAMRVRMRAQNRHPLEWGMTAEIYTLLVMQSAVRGQWIDTDAWTLLDGEAVVRRGRPGSFPTNYVPVGTCMPLAPGLSFKPSVEWVDEDQLERARCHFRRVLGGRLIEAGL